MPTAAKTPFLGQRIKAAREAMKPPMTQAEIAEQLGITPNSFGRYEQGSVEPPSKAIKALTRILGRPREYFVNEPVEESSSARTSGVVVEFSGYDPYRNRAALKMSREWEDAHPDARRYVASIRNLGGDYSLPEWLEELRVADRRARRGERLDITEGADVDEVDDPDEK